MKIGQARVSIQEPGTQYAARRDRACKMLADMPGENLIRQKAAPTVEDVVNAPGRRYGYCVQT